MKKYACLCLLIASWTTLSFANGSKGPRHDLLSGAELLRLRQKSEPDQEGYMIAQSFPGSSKEDANRKCRAYKEEFYPDEHNRELRRWRKISPTRSWRWFWYKEKYTCEYRGRVVKNGVTTHQTTGAWIVVSRELE